MNAKRQSMSFTGRVCSVYFAFLACPYLLTVSPVGYVGITAWKYCWFLIGTSLYCGVMLIYSICSIWKKELCPWENVSKLDAATAGLALFYLLFTIISGLASPYSGTLIGNARYDGVITTLLYVLTTLLLMRYFSPRGWMLPLFGASVSLMCLLGIVQLIGANPLGLYPDGMNYYDAGIYYASAFWGTIGNTNLCASVLSFATGLFIAALARGKAKRAWLYAIPVVLCVFSLIELNIEAGLLALLLGVLILPPFVVTGAETFCRLCTSYGIVAASAALGKMIRFRDGGLGFSMPLTVILLFAISALLSAVGTLLPRMKAFIGIEPMQLRRILTFSSVMLLICALAVIYIAPSLPSGFLAQAHELLHGNADDNFGSGRIYIWKQVWQAIRERPLLGGGPDTLSLRGLKGFSRYSAELDLMIVSTIDAAHNEYLNIWVNQGILALCAYLAFLVVSNICWWKGAKADWTAISGAAVLFYLIQAFFGISFCSVSTYLWCALAVLNRAPMPDQ